MTRLPLAAAACALVLSGCNLFVPARTACVNDACSAPYIRDLDAETCSCVLDALVSANVDAGAGMADAGDPAGAGPDAGMTDAGAPSDAGPDAGLSMVDVVLSGASADGPRVDDVITCDPVGAPAGTLERRWTVDDTEVGTERQFTVPRGTPAGATLACHIVVESDDGTPVATGREDVLIVDTPPVVTFALTAINPITNDESPTGAVGDKWRCDTVIDDVNGDTYPEAGRVYWWAHGSQTTMGTPAYRGTARTYVPIEAGAHYCTVDLDGDGPLPTYTSPDGVVERTWAVQVAAGGAHTCIVTVNGRVLCVGDNSEGQVEPTEMATSITDAVGVSLPHAVRQVATGFAHTCARTTRDHVWCWGEDTDGQTGRTASQSDAAFVQVRHADDTPLSGVLDIQAGDHHTCARVQATSPDEVSGVYCWGDNSKAQLAQPYTGTGAVNTSPHALFVPVIGTTVQLRAGGSHTCAAVTSMQNTALSCWGDNERGQLGVPPSPPSPSVRQGYTYSGNASDAMFALGAEHTCVATPNRLACWGDNQSHQSGSDTSQLLTSPTNTFIDGTTSVHAGDGHTCVSVNAQVQCRGANDLAECGGGPTGDVVNPRQVRYPPPTGGGIARDVRVVPGSLSAGAFHTCAIVARPPSDTSNPRPTQSIVCWGATGDGRLGSPFGAAMPSFGPIDVNLGFAWPEE